MFRAARTVSVWVRNNKRGGLCPVLDYFHPKVCSFSVGKSRRKNFCPDEIRVPVLRIFFLFFFLVLVARHFKFLVFLHDEFFLFAERTCSILINY